MMNQIFIQQIVGIHHSHPLKDGCLLFQVTLVGICVLDLTKSTEENRPVKNPQPAPSVCVVVARPCFFSCPSLGDVFLPRIKNP